MSFAKIVSLVGFARAMPDVSTFSTPIFVDGAGEYVVQMERDGFVESFEGTNFGEEFVESPLQLALKVGDPILLCFELAFGVFLVGAIAAVRPVLCGLAKNSNSGFSEETKATIWRNLGQAPVDKSQRRPTMAMVVRLVGSDAPRVTNLDSDLTTTDLLRYLGALSKGGSSPWDGLLQADDSSRGMDEAVVDVAIQASRLSRALDLARMGSFDWKRGQATPQFSVEGLRVFGLASSEKLTFRTLLRLLTQDARRGLAAALREVIRQCTFLAIDIPVTHQDGFQRIVHIEAEPEFDEHGEVVGYTGIVQDVTDRRVAEDRIRHLANYDALTGLPNRRQLMLRSELAIERARRLGHQVAILLIDLDRFREINESYGHAAGDEILVEISRRLRSCVHQSEPEIVDLLDRHDVLSHRSLEVVGRLDGDQFIALLPEVVGEHDAAQVASRILDLMRAPIVIAGQECLATVSVGIAVFPRDGLSVADLLRNADVAMYSGKERGRNSMSLYRANLPRVGREKLELESALHKAIERDELVLHYQPKIDVRGARMIGAEALVRWRRHGGLLPPGAFIPLAEETGLIVSLSKWAIGEAARQARSWKDKFGFSESIALNIPSSMFDDDSLVQCIDEAVRVHGVSHASIQLEITETGLMKDLAMVIPTLNKLSAVGVQISVDDFGTGYSSLAYLTTLPISELKIDRAFIRDVATTPQSLGVVTAIVALARSLNLRVVAEGVENLRQMEVLERLGCSMQGFLFCKPQPADDIERWLQHPVFPAQVPWIERASVWIGSHESSLAGRIR
jgi:predicted signal transduction protein with EAL and GGDEF domain